MAPEINGLDKSSPYNIIIHGGVAFITPEADDNRLADEHRPNNGLDKSSPYIKEKLRR